MVAKHSFLFYFILFYFSHSTSTGSRWACERVGEQVGEKRAGGEAGWRGSGLEGKQAGGEVGWRRSGLEGEDTGG